MGGDVMTKRIVFALLLAFAALSATTPVWADTESGSGVAGTRSGVASSRQPRADLDLRRERPVHRTHVGDLSEPPALLLGQPTGQHELALDLVELALLGLAVGAVRGVDPGVREAHGDAVERPALLSRIQRERHGRSGAEGDQQIVVGRRAGVGAAVGDGLV